MKNSPLRVNLARSIRALRAHQRQDGVYPKYWLGREWVPRKIANVRAEVTLRQIVEAACNGWAELHQNNTTDRECEVVESLHCEQQSTAPSPLSALLAESEKRGLDLNTVTLAFKEQPVAWEDYTEEVVVLSDMVRASDEQYVAQIEEFWNEHQKNKLQTEEEKASFAIYQALKARFDPLNGFARETPPHKD